MNRSQVGYVDNIEQATLDNPDYRRVGYTGKLQLVLMKLRPGEEIGEEVHDDHDQFFRIESGQAKIIIGDEVHQLADDDAAIVPAGKKHNVINTSNSQDLLLYTIYAPPEHPAGTVHHTKQDETAHA